jgi:hypothetical protein
MPRLSRVVIALGVLGGLAYGADRLAAHLAQDRIATVVQADAHLAQRPAVRVRGFPFLTQAVRGRYDRIDVVSRDLFQRAGATTAATTAGGAAGSVLTLRFLGVHIPLSQAVNGKVHRIPIDQVVGAVSISFADLQAAVHATSLSLSPVAGHPDEIALGETVDVAGRSIAVTVTGQVAVNNNRLMVSARDVTVAGGLPLPAAATAQLRSRATFSVQVPGLPGGVSLTRVVVGSAGLTIEVNRGSVVLTR